VGVQTFFLGQSIGIDKNNIFQLKVYSSTKTVGATVSGKTVGATVLGVLWALGWAWHIAETNKLAETNLIVPEISAFSQTDGHG